MMDQLKKRILTESEAIAKEVVAWRRHLHAHPELSMQEHNTARYVAAQLKSAGISYQEGIAETGIVGIIEGKTSSGKTVALRADMDALPIMEQRDISYCSTNEGVMHACGHDAHMAVVLGAATVISRMRDSYAGNVKLLFQPSEESYPGGASMLINAGVLENPVPDVILGEHVYPELEAGKVGFRSGKYMASTDEFFITVKGRGGHGAIPDRNIDPVVAAAHIITSLQQIVSRNARPVMPTVLSIGRVIADGQTNIIPDEVRMEGIIRTFDETWREEVKNRIRTIASSVARAHGAEAVVKVNQGYPFLENDPEVTEKMRGYARELLGDENVVDLEPRMTAEDFAYYLQKVPGCFYRLGTRNEEKGITSNLHTATFDIDESSLQTGVALMAWLTLRTLNG
jgi:amidohydrolase